jgi:hypothetical protein
LATSVALAILVTSYGRHIGGRPNAEQVSIQRKVATLFAGIPQHGVILGQLTAPVTLQVFVDLEDHGDGTRWFDEMLPPILEQFVRTNVVRLAFHSLKTDTVNRKQFVMQQTAALAAGAQNLLWNYAATFMNEQGTEFTNYVTEQFVLRIARQIPGLNLAKWQESSTIGLARFVETENYTARHQLGLYVTPAFRIGVTGGKIKNFSGHTIVIAHKYIVRTKPSGEGYIAGVTSEWQHPVSLIDVTDLKKAVEELI